MSTILQQPRSALLAIEREAASILERAESPDVLAPRVRVLADALPDGPLQETGRTLAEVLSTARPSDYSRSAALHVTGEWLRSLHRNCTFNLSETVDDLSYIRFLRAALHEDRKLAQGTLSLHDVGRRAQLSDHLTDCAAARALDEELAYVSDVDGKLYALLLSHEDVEHALAHVLPTAIRPVGPTQLLHHHGDIVVGNQYKSAITNSVIGAVAVGEHATATGSSGLAGASFNQEQHRTAIKEAQKALLDDEDRLDKLVYEALGQFLRLTRDIQVEQRSLAEVQSAMKSTLDEVWAQQIAKGMKPQALPQTLEVVGAIAKHPATTEVVRKLLGG